MTQTVESGETGEGAITGGLMGVGEEGKLVT